MTDILDDIAAAVLQRNSLQTDLQNKVTTAEANLATANAQLLTTNTQILDLKAQLVVANDALVQCQQANVTSPSGASAPNTDLPGWKLIFSDDLTTDVPLGQFPTAVSDKWTAYPNTYKDTSKNGTYDPAKTISIAGSLMKIHMYTDSTGVIRVAAPVPKIGPTSTTIKWPGQLYGRYSVRTRFVNLAPGFKVAWLLWPDSGTNTTGSPSGVGGNGEIDYPEHDLNQNIKTSAFMHRQDATLGSDQFTCSINTDLSKWHTFTTEWSKDLCRFLCDDVEIGKTTTRVPSTSMHWILQSETSLSGIKPAATAVGDIEIDWVAVWSKV